MKSWRLFTLISVAAVACEDPIDPEVRYAAGDVTVVPGQTDRFAFDEDDVGAPPGGGTVFAGQWEVEAAEDAPSPGNVVCQRERVDFPAISLGPELYRDGEIRTRFKAITGEVDRAAGIVFRAQDSDNYYVVRANALEANVAFYIYASGERYQLGEDGAADVTAGTWHELSLVMDNDEFVASLDGLEVNRLSDASYAAGGVGLWTKADSVTCFDDFEVEAR